jgi:hypothetical protein
LRGWFLDLPDRYASQYADRCGGNVKALVVGAPYNLSDDQIEYQVRRLSFMRFWASDWRIGCPMRRPCRSIAGASRRRAQSSGSSVRFTFL